MDLEKLKREQLRWLILTTLNAARPIGANEHLVLATARDVLTDTTPRELRRELDYLEERGLARVRDNGSNVWFADLTREGIDVAEYTVDCDPGIARPPKYW